MMLQSSDIETDIERLEKLILKTGAFQFSPEKQFLLASGRLSDYYFDLKKLNGDAEGINIVAKILYNKIKKMKGVESIGGLVAGSISIASAISQLSYLEHQNNPENPVINSFFVRKIAKEHGTGKQIEGNIDSPVVVVDDVITSGDSAIQAVEAVRDKGFECKRLISIVFRGTTEQEEKINKVSKFEYLFTEEELVKKFTKDLKLNQIA